MKLDKKEFKKYYKLSYGDSAPMVIMYMIEGQIIEINDGWIVLTADCKLPIILVAKYKNE